MSLSVFREYFDSGKPITIRSDGYWNATEMCQRHGRLFADFLRLKSTKAYLEALSPVMGIPITELIQQVQGGTPQLQGTWVHPRVALKLAAWLNAAFEVWVYSMIEKLLTQGKVELQEELSSLKHALNQSEYNRDELRRDMLWHRQNSWDAAMDDVTPYD
jgi:hypothetical protein